MNSLYFGTQNHRRVDISTSEGVIAVPFFKAWKTQWHCDSVMTCVFLWTSNRCAGHFLAVPMSTRPYKQHLTRLSEYLMKGTWRTFNRTTMCRRQLSISSRVCSPSKGGWIMEIWCQWCCWYKDYICGLYPPAFKLAPIFWVAVDAIGSIQIKEIARGLGIMSHHVFSRIIPPSTDGGHVCFSALSKTSADHPENQKQFLSQCKSF